ncbi:cell division protein FtsL [Cohnella silvisoli]|uniref:Cell division protein FtsL n=1 Tax=Cohnella silvisoli TaxID=2873699 RepID=A0ABV1KYL0_9BACL|nr:cell division protein FtsL [Cohnella silvisoli]MCD9024437.1 cell division protein FtsL [Cohnella silvisoli]
MAYYGNLALRPERIQEEKVQQTQTTHRSKVTRRRSIPIGEKLLYLFTIAVVVVVAGFIIFRYAQIYQINAQIQVKNKTYEQTSEQMKELQREVERLSDPKLIVEKATAQGMRPIANNGITVTSKEGQTAMADKPNKG